MTSSATLHREFALFAREYTRRRPRPELAKRYARAVESLLPPESRESAALLFVRRHPWALPWLDGACGWRRPDDPLRKRLLIAAAILETAPDHADDFLPEHHGRFALLFLLGTFAKLGVFYALLGSLLLAYVDRQSGRPRAKAVRGGA